MYNNQPRSTLMIRILSYVALMSYSRHDITKVCNASVKCSLRVNGRKMNYRFYTYVYPQNTFARTDSVYIVHGLQYICIRKMRQWPKQSGGYMSGVSYKFAFTRPAVYCARGRDEAHSIGEGPTSHLSRVLFAACTYVQRQGLPLSDPVIYSNPQAFMAENQREGPQSSLSPLASRAHIVYRECRRHLER